MKSICQHHDTLYPDENLIDLCHNSNYFKKIPLKILERCFKELDDKIEKLNFIKYSQIPDRPARNATLEKPHLNSFAHPCLQVSLWYISAICYEFGEIGSKNHVKRECTDGTQIPKTLAVLGGQSFRLGIHLQILSYYEGKFCLNEVDNANLPRDFTEMNSQSQEIKDSNARRLNESVKQWGSRLRNRVKEVIMKIEAYIPKKSLIEEEQRFEQEFFGESEIYPEANLDSQTQVYHKDKLIKSKKIVTQQTTSLNNTELQPVQELPINKEDF
ncbi:18789_t:CDS:2 [Acaulospora morrowiae]|uniref:18789_t:CDS:1 n=1 Tax=Acaulospora morrowiae TaxID=94023 RepID=A0A9N9ABN6_9GLOM|nr:18789_t:CDS:2 [Acaulospora morrowiae]